MATTLPASVTPFGRALQTVQNTAARTLAHNMLVRAEELPSYCEVFDRWARNGGSTLQLRDAVEPFGDYWRDNDFANIVDTLDTWSAHNPSAHA